MGKTPEAYDNFLRARYERCIGSRVCHSTPYFMFIDPCNACGLSCPLCRAHADGKGPSGVLSPAVFSSLMDELGADLFRIFFFNWGEPLFNPHLPDFVRRAHGEGIATEVHTTLAFPYPQKLVDGLLDAGLDELGVSIDGFTQETYGQYRRGGDLSLALANLERLNARIRETGAATRLSWNFLRFSFNEKEIPAIEAYCRERSIDFVCRDGYIDIKRYPHWLPSGRKEEAKRRAGGRIPVAEDPGLKGSPQADSCAWHYGYSLVNADGTVDACCALYGPECKAGALGADAKFSGVWNNPFFRAARGRDGKSVCMPCKGHIKNLLMGYERKIISDYSSRYAGRDALRDAVFAAFDSRERFIRAYEAMYAVRFDTRKCRVCGRQTSFVRRDGGSLRETYCPECGASARIRDVAEAVVREACGRNDLALSEAREELSSKAIFEAESRGPLHEALKNVPGYTCSEYLDRIAPGSVNETGVRCEDLQALTYGDESFDIDITQDVLEHVERPDKAFAEIKRVLRPGGAHLFTVPLHDGVPTVTRASRKKGKLVHHYPAVHHHDALRAEGTLVYTDFGSDILDLLKRSGFEAGYAVRHEYYRSEEIPQVREGATYERYEEARRNGELIKFFTYNSAVIRAVKPSGLLFTGERFIPGKASSRTAYEHFHRYSFIRPFVRGKRVLDLASGEGYGSSMLAQSARRVVGIDISQDAVSHASKKYGAENLTFIQGSMTKIPLNGKGVFDVVVCFEALEHIRDHGSLFREVRRLLSRRGVFIVSTPNKAVYTDGTGVINEYHCRELYLPQFRKLVAKHFAHSVYFGQRIVPVSRISPEKERSIIEPEMFPGNTSPAAGLSSDTYVIAICSASPLTPGLQRRGGVMFDDNCGLFREYDEAAASWKRSESDHQARIRELEGAIAEKERVIREQEQMLDQFRTQIAANAEVLAKVTRMLPQMKAALVAKG